MRGKALLCGVDGAHGRITPACAGKSPSSFPSTGSSRDHPCTCGEKFKMGLLAGLGTGSLPRMRGKDELVAHLILQMRITPACAGKSAVLLILSAHVRDHPRMCGEKFPGLCKGVERMGITPACAGKSLHSSTFPSVSWDHPRMCGEKSQPSVTLRTAAGSPPHVRGKGEVKSMWAFVKRITPACAGKRHTDWRNGRNVRDHPRMCGEKCMFPVLLVLSVGSPPHVRGKAQGALDDTEIDRITPAGAGKS